MSTTNNKIFVKHVIKQAMEDGLTLSILSEIITEELGDDTIELIKLLQEKYN